MNPSIRRLIEAAKVSSKRKQIKPDPTSVKVVLDVPDESDRAIDQKPVTKSVTEAKAEVAVVAFGRLNPPTIGHEKMIQKMAAIAKQHGTKAKLYLSQTQDAKSNPLNYATKIKLATKAFGKHIDVVNDPSVKTFFDLPRKLNGSVQHLIVVAGSDRLPEYKKKLEAYNGKEYTFEKIEVVSAGERDPDAEGAEGMSASKARALAKAGDVDAFKEALPTSVRSDAKSIMDAIRKGMNVVNEHMTQVTEGYTETELRRLAKGIPLRGRYAPGGDEDYHDRPGSWNKPAPKAGDKFIGRDGRMWIRYKKADGTLGAKPVPMIGDKFTGKDGRRWVRYMKPDGTLGVKPLKEDQQIDEAGPFSYGAKKQKPRKGTLAYEIAANRKAADKKLGQFKIKDDMVGNAKIVRKDDISEALTLQARMKRKMAMARLKPVLRAARARALRKRADNSTLERRARKRARDIIRQRILKTVDYADLPLSARARVDALVAKRKKAITRIAMKMLPKLKRAEMSRKLGTTARIPATSGPKPTSESVAVMAVRNFLSEGASAPQSACLISPTVVPAYEAWCATRGSRMSRQQREDIREHGLIGTVVAPGKRAGEWIVESTAGQFLIPEYLADEAALVAATSHLRITD